MYLPEVFKQFTEHHGEIAGKFKEVGELCSKAGNLETKIQHLVQLGISIGAGSMICMYFLFHVPLAVVVQCMFTSNDSFPLIAVPLFMLSGLM